MISERHELGDQRTGGLLPAVLPHGMQWVVSPLLQSRAQMLEIALGIAPDGGEEDIVERGKVVLDQTGRDARLGCQRDGS